MVPASVSLALYEIHGVFCLLENVKKWNNLDFLNTGLTITNKKSFSCVLTCSVICKISWPIPQKCIRNNYVLIVVLLNQCVSNPFSSSPVTVLVSGFRKAPVGSYSWAVKFRSHLDDRQKKSVATSSLEHVS